MQNQDDANFTDSLNTREQDSLWAQNHGNVLMMFLAGLVVLGSAILLYRQSRFVAPRFPQAALIGDANVTDESAGNESHSQASGLLSLIITGEGQDEGTLVVAVYASSEAFAEQVDPLWSDQIPFQSGAASMQLTLGDISSDFAIVAFDDQNENGKFDPESTERIGFSGTLERSEMNADDAFEKATVKRRFEIEPLTIELR
ncbi:hypothetical protein RMSM_00887 [Rhodopirellula maiorica SM1]|uniref:Uncharacterized protein n=1 Tax=Rhodopirellula maiorica SM1 TaxID=1265738 RepID=M5S7P3_9BACT|nr:DUF2141 domain-containing protein [Rhodopirellula maiorica]EMI22194.1 hypothetical protein RMSM_00887 [Rhodopirellula maiorica SM1]